MANFDEDIRRITEEVLQDGTVDQIIREKIVEGFQSAVEKSFRYGELNDAIEGRVKTVLVPFIENYDMSAYIVKLDDVLTEIVNATSLVDNKIILENFKSLMQEPEMKEITISELFEQYKVYVANNMETYDREIDFDEGEALYAPMEVCVTFEKEDDRSWSCFDYAVLEFSVMEEDQQEILNKTIRLSHYKKSRYAGYDISSGITSDVYSLRYLNDFELFLTKLCRAGVRLIVDKEIIYDDVRSTAEPEATFA